MKKQVLAAGFVGLVIWGSSALISCTNPKVSNPISANPDTTTVENTVVNVDTLFSDSAIVAHIGNDTDFSFLIGGGSQPYMTIQINLRGDIMAYWGDVEHRVVTVDVDVDELRQTILGRFEAGDTLKENELFHVEFDVSTPKNIISALKDMLLGIGVDRCDLVGVHDYLNMPTLPPPPLPVITQAEILEIEAEEAETEEIFSKVEQQPEFPGGMAELMIYLQKNIKYPADCKREGIRGRVIVQFIVEKDGSLSGINVVKGVHPQLDAEALRVVDAMPNWIPGVQKSKRVRVRFTLPVTFRLSE